MISQGNYKLYCSSFCCRVDVNDMFPQGNYKYFGTPEYIKQDVNDMISKGNYKQDAVFGGGKHLDVNDMISQGNLDLQDIFDIFAIKTKIWHDEKKTA